MLKNLIRILSAAALVLAFTACPTEPPAVDAPAAPETKTAVDLATLTSVFDVAGKTAATVSYIYDEDTSDASSVPSYAMSQFLTKTAVNAKVDPAETTVDYRTMFTYNILAADGYSFLTKSNPLLDSAQMLTGHYLYDTGETDGSFTTALKSGNDPRSYFPSLDIVKGYDIKGAKDIKLFRTIRITAGDAVQNVLTDSFIAADLSWFKIKSGAETEMTNKAVALEGFFYDYFVANDTKDRTTAKYLVKCADYDAADEYTFEELTYEQLKASYFMPGTKTMAADSEYEDLLVIMTGTAADGTSPSNDNSKLRLKRPVEIVVSW